MLNFYFLFSGVCALLVLINPQLGPWLMLVVGLLADPVRKLTPENPIYIQIVFISILAIMYLTHRKIYSRDQRIFALFPDMRLPFQLFIFFLIINAVRPLLINISYIKLVLYSGVQYIALFLAAKLGFELVKDEKTIIKFSDVFIITLLPFLVSVLFHFWGFNEAYPVLSVMGMDEGRWLQYHAEGEPLSMLCGLFRNPEGMGWYAMVVSVCACFLLARKKRNLRNGLYYISVFILSSFCTLLSGRRKFFLGIFIFILIFVILAMRKNMKKGIMYLALFTIASGAFFYYIGRVESTALYLKSGQSGVDDTGDRIKSGSLGSIWSAVRKYGLFGGGLGTTAQGAKHLGGRVVESNVEAGPGKIVSDLGVPGFICFIMIFLAYIRGAYRKVVKGRFKDTSEITAVFLLALVITQIAEFAISHQIFADPLVAVLTGFMFGFLLTIPRIMQDNPAVSIKPKLQGNG